jgi:hypothetical protein
MIGPYFLSLSCRSRGLAMTALLTETARDLTTRLDEELRRQKGARLKRQILRNLASSADVLAGVTLSVWTWVRETLEGEGFEGRELAGHCQVLLGGIDESLAGYDQLLTLAETSGLSLEAAGLLDLEAKLPTLREARPKVAELLGLTAQPPRPVDKTTLLAESRAALERGEFITLDDEYLARLRAGEDF